MLILQIWSAFEELLRQDDETSIPLWWPQHVGSCSPGGHWIWSACAGQGADQKFRRSVTDPRLCDQSWKWSPVWWLFSIAMGIDDMVLDLSNLWNCSLYTNPCLKMQRLPQLSIWSVLPVASFALGETDGHLWPEFCGRSESHHLPMLANWNQLPTPGETQDKARLHPVRKSFLSMLSLMCL